MLEVSNPIVASQSWFVAQTGGSSTGELFGAQPGTAAPGGSGNPASAAPSGSPSGGGGSSMLLIMAVPLLFLIIMSFTMNKKEKKKRASLMESLKRHDRVLTIGGIIGTVTDIRDDEVVLRVDDNTKAKITFSRASIQQIIRGGDGGGAAAELSLESKSKVEKAGV